MYYPLICIICYIIVFFVRKTKIKNEVLPIISCVLGIVLAIVGFYAFPQFIATDSFLVAIFGGALSGLAATGGNQVFKQALKLFEQKYDIDILPEDDKNE